MSHMTRRVNEGTVLTVRMMHCHLAVHHLKMSRVCMTKISADRVAAIKGIIDMTMGNDASRNTPGGATDNPAVLDATAQNVKELRARGALLSGRVDAPEDSTDTIAIMLRVSPLPGVFLAVNDPTALRTMMSVLTEDIVKSLDRSDAAHMIKTLTTQPATLVLTDDVDLARNLRAVTGDGHPYILMITANDDHALREGLSAGADDCIGTGASPEMVRARVDLGRRLVQLSSCLRSVLKAHRKLATTDELTRVANRHFFAQHFPLEAERAARYAHALSVVVCDIDRFKQINDTFGHLAGDAVLREFAARLQRCLRRGTDWVARVGGEEFSIVLPETGLAAAALVAQKLRDCIRASPFRIEGREVVVTASFGVCGMAAVSARHADIPDRLQATADAALYRSKREGRDRVTAASLDLSRSRVRRRD